MKLNFVSIDPVLTGGEFGYDWDRDGRNHSGIFVENSCLSIDSEGYLWYFCIG